MAIDYQVWCSCFQRGLARPCPIDIARLDFEDWGGHPEGGADLSQPESDLLRQWSETACAHRYGFALSGPFCSSTELAHLVGCLQRQWADTCPTLLGYLETVNGIGAAGTEPAEAPVILREIEALYAAGFDTAGFGTPTETTAILHRAATVASQQGTNIIWW